RVLPAVVRHGASRLPARRVFRPVRPCARQHALHRLRSCPKPAGCGAGRGGEKTKGNRKRRREPKTSTFARRGKVTKFLFKRKVCAGERGGNDENTSIRS